MNPNLALIKIAFITFPIATFFLTLLIAQYHKYGYLNNIWSLVLYSMLLYFFRVFYRHSASPNRADTQRKRGLFPMGSSQLDVDLTRRPVGFFRRVIALLLDHLCIGFIHWIIAMLVVNGNDLVQYSGWPAKALIFYTTLAHIFFFMPITITVYFMLIPMWTGGKTFGKWVMRIHLIDDRLAADPEGPKKLSFKGLLIRYGLLYFGIGGINHLFFYTIIFGGMTLVEPFGSIIIMLWFVFNAFVVLHVLLHISRGDKRLFYEKLSGTRNVIRSRT